MTRRRWIADRWDETNATLTGAQAEHLGRVLRAQPGMEADVVAGERVFHASIAVVTADEVRFELLAEVAADQPLPVTLVLAVYKFDRMEWAIEKATELGVARIVPVIARRTEKHLGQSAAKRVERWRRIAHEAAQQSRRASVPVIEDPVALNAYAKQAATATRILLAEQERTKTLRRAVDAALLASGTELPQFEIAVGPEGGWTPEECTLFDTHGWQAATLGQRILRAETAALTALAVVGSVVE